MADHDATLHDDGFHEIQLSGKQLVFAFMAVTLLAVVIFLLGVQVGRKAPQSDRGLVADASDTAASAAVPPPASTPSQPVASSGPPAAEPPAPAAEPDDELSYAKRLQGGDSAAQDKLKTPDPARPAPAQPAPAVSPKQAPQGVAKAEEQGQPGQWIVQFTALKDRNAASGIAKRLVSKGYPAFVLDPEPGSPVIYRVQVGGYADREKADQAKGKLEKEEQIKVYVRSR